jgi:hypothetical protein
MRCKHNNAVSVKINAPMTESRQISLVSLCVGSICLLCRYLPKRKPLQPPLHVGIIMITYAKGSNPLANACRQNPDPPRKRNTEPQARQRARPVVFERSVLRPTGFDTGEIRNASSGSEGSNADQHRCSHFWVLPPGVLQSSGRFHSRRIGGAHSPTAGAQRASQTNSGNSGIRRPDPCNGTFNPNATDGPANSGSLRHSGTPQIIGAGSCPDEKKTACVIVAVPGRRRPRSPSIMKRCGRMYWREMTPRVCGADWAL